MKPPGLTCPKINKAQRAMRRLAWRARHGRTDDVSEVLSEGLAFLEEVREENRQMRSAYAAMRERLKEVDDGEA